ncbi:MAG: WD40 repeat domain-containing protein [Acidimicrobiales bacterium]
MPEPTSSAVAQLGSHPIVDLEDRICALAWSMAGRWLLSGSLAGTAVVTGDGPVRSLIGHPGGLLCSQWSPADDLVATGGADGVVRVSRADGSQLWSSTMAGWVVALAWSPDGAYLAVSSQGHVSVFASGGRLEVEYPWLAGVVDALVWSTDTGRLAAGLKGGVRWYQPPDSEPVASAPTIGAIVALASSPDGKWLAGGKLNGSVVLWTVATGRGLSLNGYRGAVRKLSWRADSARLAVASHGEVSVWSVAGGQLGEEPQTFLEDQPCCEGLAFQPWGDLLATGSADGRVRIFDPDRPTETDRSSDLAQEISALAWSPAGDQLAAGTCSGRVVSIFPDR